ncbi:hypothetical protein GcM1_202036 [Golovinomyces cichoracearum]|uniref:Uncharacterized protein n=1 Tax=Golovinomyces cichoracearum TaxID=62708 RepID=A0A420IYC6_9PEZI|nr:hypothetical protein GcM1_202036 [Golovinomyces cichoracearum]
MRKRSNWIETSNVLQVFLICLNNQVLDPVRSKYEDFRKASISALPAKSVSKEETSITEILLAVKRVYKPPASSTIYLLSQISTSTEIN